MEGMKSPVDLLKDCKGSKFVIDLVDKGKTEVVQLNAQQLSELVDIQEKIQKGDKGAAMEAAELVIFSTFKNTLPDVPGEEIKKMVGDMSNTSKLKMIPQIMKGNGLEGDAEKKPEKDLISKNE